MVNHSERADVNCEYELIDKGQKTVFKGDKDSVVECNKNIEISFNEERIENVLQLCTEHPKLCSLLTQLYLYKY